MKTHVKGRTHILSSNLTYLLYENHLLITLMVTTTFLTNLWGMTSHILSLINGVARGASDSPLRLNWGLSVWNASFCIVFRLLSYLLSVFSGFYRFLPLQCQIPTHITVFSNVFSLCLVVTQSYYTSLSCLSSVLCSHAWNIRP